MLICPPRTRCGPAQLSLAAPTHPPAQDDPAEWTAGLLGAEHWVSDVSIRGTGQVNDQNMPLATLLNSINI